MDVALQVARGTKGSGVDVTFEGNQALGDAALLAALPKPGSLAFFEALDPRTARISSSLRLAYAAIGYLHVRVSAPRSSYDPASGRLAVVIPVRERSASTVSEIALPEEVRQPGAPPLKLKLRQGEPFDLAAYVADRDALVAWYRAQGWVDAQAGASLEPRGGSLAVRYVIDKGPRPRVGSVRVLDNGHTQRQPDPPLAQGSRGRLPEAGGARRKPRAARGHRHLPLRGRAQRAAPARGRAARRGGRPGAQARRAGRVRPALHDLERERAGDRDDLDERERAASRSPSRSSSTTPSATA